MAEALSAQVTFSETGQEHGLLPYTMPVGPSGGLAAADYDNDGDIDLFVPNGEGRKSQLYRNDGSGQFENIADEAGLALEGNHRAALWFDFDNDGRLDLVIGGDCRKDPLENEACTDPADLRLFHQQPGLKFEEVTQAAGLDAHWGSWADGHRSGLVAGDVDNDGDLDLYVCNWNDRAWLYRNNGDGTFTDITLQAGLDEQVRDYHQPVMYDFNRDGWLDIYQAVDTFRRNQLWINQGNGQFENQAAKAGLANAMTDMGIALGDYDNDGDMDLYVTNITRNGDHNVLFRNDSEGSELSFSEVSMTEGVDQGYWGWGTTFFDADKDGWLDLAVSNGKNVGQWQTDPSLFYRNNGSGSPWFADQSESAGFNDTFITASLISLDFDRDGDLDLMQSVSEIGLLRLMENTSQGVAATNNYLVIRPRRLNKNRFAIGAEVSVKAGNLELLRSIRSGTSTLGQEPAEAHFGLGSNPVAQEVVVRWPGGGETRLENVAAGQVLEVIDPASGQAIHAGFTDAWYNPQTNGQGFFIVVWPQLEQVFLSWFTFDAERPPAETPSILGEPGHRWLTAQGAVSGRRATLQVYATGGGLFDQGDPVPSSAAVGTIELEFSDCESGVLDYQLDGGRSGSMSLQRVVADRVALCEALDGEVSPAD